MIRLGSTFSIGGVLLGGALVAALVFFGADRCYHQRTDQAVQQGREHLASRGAYDSLQAAYQHVSAENWQLHQAMDDLAMEHLAHANGAAAKRQQLPPAPPICASFADLVQAEVDELRGSIDSYQRGSVAAAAAHEADSLALQGARARSDTADRRISALIHAAVPPRLQLTLGLQDQVEALDAVAARATLSLRVRQWQLEVERVQPLTRHQAAYHLVKIGRPLRIL